LSFLNDLPADVAHLLRTQTVAEYATVSAAGTPIDTPTFAFIGPDLATLDVATGLAYPLKAERARRNPKVGLLIEGGPGRPVVSIAGLAAVRDADLQANLERYLAETILTPLIDPEVVDWATTSAAVWYLARVFVSITPKHIRWWSDPGAMNAPPQEWRAPADTVFPPSDPEPVGAPSPAAAWPQPPWPEVAAAAVARGAPAHMALMDADGFPLPYPVRDVVLDAHGFRLRPPRGAPVAEGPASLSFAGREMFLGRAVADSEGVRFEVERALPLFPLAADFTEILYPKPETQAALMSRLRREAERRGQPAPTAPPKPPAPTAGARLRAQAEG
jgi:hypothetical protein